MRPLGQQPIHHFHQHRLHILITPPLLYHPIHHALTITHEPLPNAITAHNNKLIVLRPVRHGDIRLAYNELLVVGSGLVFLVVEVA